MTSDAAGVEKVHCQSMPGTGFSSSGNGFAPSSIPRPRGKARRRNRPINSCLECRRRKMKCERTNPCQNCRSSQLNCIYVTSANEDAQMLQKLTEIKEARDAIDDTLRGELDDLVNPATGGPQRKRTRRAEQVLSEDTDTSADDQDLEPTPLAVQDAAYADDADDDVEDLGFRVGRMRMGERIGGLYRPRLADEILASLQQDPRDSSQIIPSPMTPDQTEELLQPGPYFTAPSVNLLFSEVSSRDDLTRYLPPRGIADDLLNWYWDAIHPVARIVHRPSFSQRYEIIWEMIDTGYQLPPSLAAMVYSILFSASVAMSEERVFELCQTSRQDLKNSLQRGTELALSRAQLLRARKIETLQAFVAYLLPICLDDISRAHSTLTGMLIRLAECMGLHRDPAEFGFSSPDCQTRRLVWYQVCYLDLKTSIVQGPRPFIERDGYTTQLPLDVTSLPSAESPPVWNDMILSLIRFECQEMHRQLIAFRSKLERKTVSLTKVVSEIGAFCTEMDSKYGIYLKVASPTPIQKVASLVLQMFTGLFYVNLLSRYMTSVTYRIPDRLRQIVLIKGTEALEAGVELESENDFQKWAWYSSSWNGYHSAFLLLFEVFNFPMRKEANRIWKCLDFIFADVLVHFPPLEQQGVAPTIKKLIAHRDGKARFLLMMIAERTRAYQKVKGAITPVRFKDSMIVITPQKEGDGTDTRMPLNYAHGEPETEANAYNSTANPNSAAPARVGVVSGRPQAPLEVPAESRTYQCHDYSHDQSYASDTWESSSKECAPWVHVEEPRLDGPANAMRYTDSQGYSMNTATNEDTSANSDMYGRTEAIDPKMLEIDWTLWDSIFPPQVNDGNLDISDYGLWNIDDDLNQ